LHTLPIPKRYILSSLDVNQWYKNDTWSIWEIGGIPVWQIKRKSGIWCVCSAIATEIRSPEDFGSLNTKVCDANIDF